MRYFVEERKQKSVGSCSKRFGGPDTYVAVIGVPDGVEAPYNLRQSTLHKRGISYKYFGEGYSNRQATYRSALGRAQKAAREYAEWKNRVETLCEQSREYEV